MKQALGKNINVDLGHQQLEFADRLLKDAQANRKIELKLILSSLQRAETMQDVQTVINNIKTLLEQ